MARYSEMSKSELSQIRQNCTPLNVSIKDVRRLMGKSTTNSRFICNYEMYISKDGSSIYIINTLTLFTKVLAMLLASGALLYISVFKRKQLKTEYTTIKECIFGNDSRMLATFLSPDFTDNESDIEIYTGLMKVAGKDEYVI